MELNSNLLSQAKEAKNVEKLTMEENKTTELVDEQLKDVAGGSQLESVNSSYGFCPKCNAPLVEPKRCNKCDWSFSSYLYSCPLCGHLDENRNSCSKCGWKRDYTGGMG